MLYVCIYVCTVREYNNKYKKRKERITSHVYKFEVPWSCVRGFVWMIFGAFSGSALPEVGKDMWPWRPKHQASFKSSTTSHLHSLIDIASQCDCTIQQRMSTTTWPLFGRNVHGAQHETKREGACRCWWAIGMRLLWKTIIGRDMDVNYKCFHKTLTVDHHDECC